MAPRDFACTALLAAVALVSCKKSEPEATRAADAATATTRDASPEAAPESRAADADLGTDARAVTCGENKACALLAERAAGRDAEGRELSIASVRVAVSAEEGMETREHWVLGKRGAKIVTAHRVVEEWVQKDRPVAETASVSDNQLVAKIDFWPTSTWQSWPERTFRLSPPSLTTFAATPQQLNNPDNVGSTSMALDRAGGAGDGTYRCGPRAGSFLPIPAIPRGKGFDLSRGLGRCATLADGTKGHGFVVVGRANRASGSFAVAYIGALLIEVKDDHWTPKDRVELRIGRPAGFFGCTSDTPLPPARRYAIDGEGTLTVLSPGAPNIKVERVRADGDTRVFRVAERESDLQGISVAVSDDDGDGAPARVIATTPIATSQELGDFADVADVACDASEGDNAIVPAEEGSHVPK